MNYTIFLVDDHDIVRFGLQTLLTAKSELTVVGSASSIASAVPEIERIKPDLVITDMSMEDSKGLETVKTIVRTQNGRRVLVLSMHDELMYAEQVLSIGAHGYLMKEKAQENIVNAATTILEGGIWVSPRANSQLLRRISKNSKEYSANFKGIPLSQREIEILGMLSAGKTTKEMAFELQISIRTVDIHRANLKKKLGLKSGSELIAYAASRAA